jgi:hypothetical protein
MIGTTEGVVIGHAVVLEAEANDANGGDGNSVQTCWNR